MPIFRCASMGDRFVSARHRFVCPARWIEFAPTDQFAVEMDDFAQCIMEKRATKVSGEEGLRDVTLMMAIYESARTGKPIDLRSS